MTEEFSSTGIKDMHPMQIEALVQFIGLAFDLASQFEGNEAIEEVEARADELIRIFGGNGVTVRLEVELDH
jgi:hypothetical protein